MTNSHPLVRVAGRHFFVSLALFLVAGGHGVVARAQPAARLKRASGRVRVESRVSRRRFALGDTVQLTVQIHATQPVRGAVRFGSAYDNYVRPSMPDFDLLRTSSSQSINLSFGGGSPQRVSTETYQYQIRARRAGRLAIGSARVRVGGRIISSRPITVVVTSQGAPAVSPGASGLPAAPSLSQDGVALTASADRKTCYVGQQVTVTWSIYHTYPLTVLRPVSMPSASDALVEDLFQIGPRTMSRRQNINGRVVYVTPLYRKAFFATKPGTLKVSPLDVDVETARFPGRMRRRSPQVVVTVLPLPKKGKPTFFPKEPGRNVGQYRITASLDRTNIDAGEAATLTVKVAGTGHPDLVALDPLTHVEGLKVRASPPKSDVRRQDSIGGTRTYEYILIGIKAGSHEISAFKFAYFDPKDHAYHVVQTRELAVTVTGSLQTSGSAGATGGPANVLSIGIRPIHGRVALVTRIGPRFYETTVFEILVALPPLVLLGLGLFVLVRIRLSRETDAGRRRKVLGRARRRLRAARQKLQEDDAAGFFGEVARVIEEVLSEKLSRPVSGMTSDELRKTMTQAGLDDDLIERVLRELGDCDFARFSPAAASRQEMERAFDRVRKLTGLIDRVKLAERVS
ncbi:MAG: protein BatD [Deltaproteobacteria bacterium]|nr:protein BatD [Deltaproteobacteria bacterium]